MFSNTYAIREREFWHKLQDWSITAWKTQLVNENGRTPKTYQNFKHFR